MGPDDIVLGSYSKLLPNTYDVASVSLYTLSYDHEVLGGGLASWGATRVLALGSPPSSCIVWEGFSICYGSSGQRNICPGADLCRSLRAKADSIRGLSSTGLINECSLHCHCHMPPPWLCDTATSTALVQSTYSLPELKWVLVIVKWLWGVCISLKSRLGFCYLHRIHQLQDTMGFLHFALKSRWHPLWHTCI